jgi:plastocyanin
MLSGLYLFVFVAMIWGMKAVPANAATIQVTIDKLVFAPVEVKAKVGDTITWINHVDQYGHRRAYGDRARRLGCDGSGQ